MQGSRRAIGLQEYLYGPSSNYVVRLLHVSYFGADTCSMCLHEAKHRFESNETTLKSPKPTCSATGYGSQRQVLPVEYGGLDSFTTKWGDSYVLGKPADFSYVYHNCDFKSDWPHLAFHPLHGRQLVRPAPRSTYIGARSVI